MKAQVIEIKESALWIVYAILVMAVILATL